MPGAERTTGELATFSAAPNRVIPPYWEFKQYGQSGRWMSSLLPNLATRVDDLAFIHGLKVDNNNHGPAVYHTLTGNISFRAALRWAHGSPTVWAARTRICPASS